MYLLARELTGSRTAASAGGMYYAFGPFNDTVALWICQTAPSRASWSIHELRLWRR